VVISSSFVSRRELSNSHDPVAGVDALCPHSLVPHLAQGLIIVTEVEGYPLVVEAEGDAQEAERAGVFVHLASAGRGAAAVGAAALVLQLSSESTRKHYNYNMHKITIVHNINV
jgi:hypothetical protein